MAPKVTSSGNRSGRKPSKPPVVTTSKGRGNRSSVSTARVSTGSNGKPQGGGGRVTNASQRTNTGSTRVTGGGNRAALPPAKPKPNAAPTRPSIGNVSGPASNPKPSGTNASLKPNGSFKAPSVSTPRPSAKPSVTPAVKPRLTLGRGGAATLALSAISGIQDKFLTQAQLDKKYENEKGKVYRELMDKMSGKQPVRKDANGRSSQGIRVSDKANKRDYVSAPTGSQEYNDFRQKQIEAEKQRLKNVGNAPARSTSSSPSSSRGSSSPARMPSSVTRSSSPKAPAAPAKPGQKFEDFNPNRGRSKTNNPLMKDFVGRMKDREDKAQASAASKVTSKFNTESNFSGEKVDGSNVNTKAKMKSTTSEYDKKKRRYGG
jgi:hypothetical protein